MNAHILLVDDDTDLLKLLSMRLTAAGYRVTTATTAEGALTRLAVELPQLVLSDVRLPDRDGLSLFGDIHARHPTLPVILLTAHGTIPDAVAATERGVFGYLTKPFDGKLLLAKIAQALSIATPGGQAGQNDDEWRSPIVSRSSLMAELLAEARLVAGT
ncbi:MAG: response regulator, partial [Chitinimonas sp.]|nr:response regulator [Chitinimonas sp.]